MNIPNWQLVYKQADKELGIEIASQLGIESHEITIQQFRDTESLANSNGLKPCNTILICNCPPPVNQNILELLLCLNLLKNAGIDNIIAVIPYLPYHRQDKIATNGCSSIAAGMLPNLIAASGASSILTLDLYNRPQTPSSPIPIHSISHLAIFADILPTLDLTNTIIVAPDQGAEAIAQEYATNFKLPVINLKKHRAGSKVLIKTLDGKIHDKNCILVDDITDSGNTIIAAAEALSNSGATQINAFVTHSILSGNATSSLEKSKISTVYTTNSTYLNTENNKTMMKFHVKHCSSVLVNKLKEITINE